MFASNSFQMLMSFHETETVSRRICISQSYAELRRASLFAVCHSCKSLFFPTFAFWLSFSEILFSQIHTHSHRDFILLGLIMAPSRYLPFCGMFIFLSRPLSVCICMRGCLPIPLINNSMHIQTQNQNKNQCLFLPAANAWDTIGQEVFHYKQMISLSFSLWVFFSNVCCCIKFHRP